MGQKIGKMMKGDIVFKDNSQGSNIHECEILCSASDQMLTFRFLRKPDAYYGYFLLKHLKKLALEQNIKDLL